MSVYRYLEWLLSKTAAVGILQQGYSVDWSLQGKSPLCKLDRVGEREWDLMKAPSWCRLVLSSLVDHCGTSFRFCCILPAVSNMKYLCLLDRNCYVRCWMLGRRETRRLCLGCVCYTGTAAFLDEGRDVSLEWKLSSWGELDDTWTENFSVFNSYGNEQCKCVQIEMHRKRPWVLKQNSWLFLMRNVCHVGGKDER